MGAPSVEWDGRCSVCGRPASNRHHVVQKGIGGTAREAEIPTVLLCGMGNASGCHGLAHQRRLHLNFDGTDWLYRITDEPMADEDAWEDRGEWAELPAWMEMKLWSGTIYGSWRVR